jgi:DNA-binding GntR family transcriptional regulator
MESQLAEVLEMSPMPIREAVRRTDAAGLVENIPRTRRSTSLYTEPPTRPGRC